MTMRKRLAVGGATVLALVVAELVNAPGGTGTTFAASRSYTYVAAGGFHVFGPGDVAEVASEEAGVHIAPLGEVSFVAPDDEFTFQVTDHNPHADAAVSIVSANGRYDVCAPRGAPITVSGVPAGSPVSLSIWDAVEQRTWCPSNRATTGTLTITP